MSHLTCSHCHIGSRASQCHFTSSHPFMCTWLFELPLPCLFLLLPPVLPPLPDTCHGACRELHGRSPVQLQFREHGQPGLCHTRHTSSTVLISPIDVECEHLEGTTECHCSAANCMFSNCVRLVIPSLFFFLPYRFFGPSHLLGVVVFCPLDFHSHSRHRHCACLRVIERAKSWRCF